MVKQLSKKCLDFDRRCTNKWLFVKTNTFVQKEHVKDLNAIMNARNKKQ